MTGTPDPIDTEAAAVMEAMAPVLGITIAPAWRSGVTMQLATSMRIAAVVFATPGGDHDDPAALFRPATSGDGA